MSNLLKKTILTEIQNATGRQVIAEKIYINLLPPYLEAKKVKVFDDKGERAFTAERIKGYISFRHVFEKKVTLDRIVLIRPKIWLDRSQVDDISGNVKRKPKTEGEFFTVDVTAVTVKGGELSYYDGKLDTVVTVTGVSAEAVIKDFPEVRFSAHEISALIEEWPELKGSVKGLVEFRDDAFQVKEMEINSYGSELKSKGTYSKGGNADFDMDMKLLVSSLKEALGLEAPGIGTINARGSVSVAGDFKNPVVDLRLRGDMSLEALMEIVRTEEYLTGIARFDGFLKGSLSDLNGRADVKMDKGSFFGIEVGRTTCTASYGQGVLKFMDGEAELYGGAGKVEVSISLPKVRPYSVDVSFKDVDIGPALKLIGLETLELPAGKVKGKLYSAGRDFNPEGWIEYVSNKETGEPPFGKVKTVVGNYHVEGAKVTLSGFDVKTPSSTATFDGFLDRSARTMDFSGRLVTKDISELLPQPYDRLSGSGNFEGTVSGTLEDPKIKGNIRGSAAHFDHYLLGNVFAEISYRKDALEIASASAEDGPREIFAKGAIQFHDAKKIMDIDKPVYSIDMSLKKTDMGGLMNMLGVDADLEGDISSVLTISGEGKKPVVSGSASVTDATIYQHSVTEASFRYAFEEDRFSLSDGIFNKGASTLKLGGAITMEGEYDFNASSPSVNLSDFITAELPLDYTMELEANGHGTFREPTVRVSSNFLSGEFKGFPMKGGFLNAKMVGKNIEFDARLMDEKVTVDGSAVLEGDMPWRADLTVRQGMYNFLIVPFLKKTPDDLLFSVSGTASLSGTKKHFSADARLETVNLNLFGQGFSNVQDVKISVRDTEISFSKFAMRGGNTSFDIRGSLKLNALYDISIEGSSSLSPLSIFSDKIDTLRGDADFVFAIRGGWEDPQINGGLNMTNGFLALKNVPQRLSAIESYVYIAGDRAVIQKFTASIGGGEINASGFIDLVGFKPEKGFLESSVENVTVAVSKGFVVNLGGTLLYRRTKESQDISGDLVINRAVYRERLEWKSWLLKAGRREVTVKEKEWGSDIGINIKLTGSEGIVLDNNIGRTKLIIDLIARGTVAAPRFYGRIEAAEGKVFFRNSEFTILSATADYSDSRYTDPYIGIRAETTLQGYNVHLNLEGKIERLDLSLTSSPPLNEEEILGLLTVGQFGENLTGMEGGIGAAEATSFLTGKVQDVLEERFADITGLDRFQIDPYVSRSTGTVTPRVTVAKRLVGEKLFVTYATTGEEQALRLEYLLNRNVSLQGGQDERGSIGGDIKFRFHFE